MSQQANGNRRAGESSARFVVVRVEDTIEPELAGTQAGATRARPRRTIRRWRSCDCCSAEPLRMRMARGSGQHRSPAGGAWSR